MSWQMSLQIHWIPWNGCIFTNLENNSRFYLFFYFFCCGGPQNEYLCIRADVVVVSVGGVVRRFPSDPVLMASRGSNYIDPVLRRGQRGIITISWIVFTDNWRAQNIDYVLLVLLLFNNKICEFTTTAAHVLPCPPSGVRFCMANEEYKINERAQRHSVHFMKSHLGMWTYFKLIIHPSMINMRETNRWFPLFLLQISNVFPRVRHHHEVRK